MADRWFHDVPWQGLILSAAIVLAALVADRLWRLALDRMLSLRRGEQEGHDAIHSLETRVRVVRRLGRAAIYLVAAAAALSHFTWLRVLSAGLWASAGVAGLVMGMAARGTLGNAIAGVTLAFSQPFRVGDIVTVRTETGVVEDVTLMFTVIRTGDNRRLVIPNDVLSSEILYNHSIVDRRILATVKIHVSYGADLTAAMRALAQVAKESPAMLATEGAPTVAVGEAGPTVIRLEVSAWCESQAKAWAFQADVRERGLVALGQLAAVLPAPFAAIQKS
ncbi:MAG: mechanosensitive ion channel family protein [Deltaproteobacteria bacterium]